MAEGMGFEPMTPVSQGNRLAGGRTRPLCDPSAHSAILAFGHGRLQGVWRFSQRLTGLQWLGRIRMKPEERRARGMSERVSVVVSVCLRPRAALR